HTMADRVGAAAHEQDHRPARPAHPTDRPHDPRPRADRGRRGRRRPDHRLPPGPRRTAVVLPVGAPGRLAPGPRRRPGVAPACSRTRTGRALEGLAGPAGPRVPAVARLPAVTRKGRTKKEKPPFEPGLIPAPGELLVWRDGQHFDRWQD